MEHGQNFDTGTPHNAFVGIARIAISVFGWILSVTLKDLSEVASLAASCIACASGLMAFSYYYSEKKRKKAQRGIAITHKK